MNANEVAAYIADHDGGTFALDHLAGSLVVREYADGYAVGIAPQGTAITLPLDSSPDRVYGALMHVVHEWLVSHVGAWVDGGLIHIDPVMVLTDRYTAIRAARNFGQVAIYGFAERDTIMVLPDTGGVL